MEYILEELLRQRKALAVLMNGGSLERQDGSGEEPAARRSDGGMAVDETASDAYMESAGVENGRLGSVRRDGDETTSGEAAGEVLDEDSRDASGWQVRERERGAASAGRTGWRLERLDSGERALVRNTGMPGGSGAVEAVSVREIPQWDGGAAETDARALSRAVQRDARRYDGGFMAR